MSATTAAVDSTANMLLPYAPGRTLNLKAADGTEMQAVVSRMYSVTVSPVMEVRLKTQDGDEQTAVLKLYDRRFGSNRREPYSRTGRPHTPETEAAWKEYLSSGMAETLLKQLRYNDRPAFAYNDEDDDDEPQSKLEQLGKIECKAYYYCQKQHSTEVQAYRKLKALQGSCIPEFIASVTFDSIPVPDDLPGCYFQVPGILLEHVPGFPFRDIILRIPEKPQLWQELIQAAVDLTVKVNQAGVFHNDCKPRNFLVKELGENKYQLYLLDFANGGFREEFKDTLDEEDEDGYRWQVKRGQDGEEIACIMGGIVYGGDRA
ncbi:Fc.00g115200.m01.CDS01 [Cosmosporella sp. VM-42]